MIVTADIAAIQDAETRLGDFDVAGLRNASDEQLCLMVEAAESLARRLASIQVLGAAEIAHRSRPALGPDGLSEKQALTSSARPTTISFTNQTGN